MEPGSTPRPLVQKKKKLGRDSLPIDMLLSAVSVLVVAQSSSEIPEGLMNNPVFLKCEARMLLDIRAHKDLKGIIRIFEWRSKLKRQESVLGLKSETIESIRPNT